MERDERGHFIAVKERPKVSVPLRPPRKPGSGLGSGFTSNSNPKKSRHLIDDISFSKDFIVCTCAWKGAVDSYQPHRKEMEPSVPKTKS